MTKYKCKYKCIIVEGPDNCGKDTACDLLRAEILNNSDFYPVCVHSLFNKNVNDFKRDMREYKYFITDFINNMPDNYILICNRSHLDEFIYGPMYRNYSAEDLEYLMQSTSTDVSVLYVYLTDTPEVLVSREDGLSLSNGYLDKITEEVKLFDNLYDNVKFDKVRIVTSNVPREDMGKEIYKNL